MRSFRDLLKANGVADDKYAALAMPAAESGAPSTATVPIGRVDTSERLRHTIHFLDAAAGGSKRRPKGVKGCQIWRKIDGPLPGSEIDCTFLVLDSATPYTVEYPPEHAGKIVHYMLRWHSRCEDIQQLIKSRLQFLISITSRSRWHIYGHCC